MMASLEYDSMRSDLSVSPPSRNDPSPEKELSCRFSALNSGVPRLLLADPTSNWSSLAACFTGRDLNIPLGGSVVNSALRGEGGTLEEPDLPSTSPGRDLFDKLSFFISLWAFNLPLPYNKKLYISNYKYIRIIARIHFYFFFYSEWSKNYLSKKKNKNKCWFNPKFQGCIIFRFLQNTHMNDWIVWKGHNSAFFLGPIANINLTCVS
jgi:hypothetical protein